MTAVASILSWDIKAIAASRRRLSSVRRTHRAVVCRNSIRAKLHEELMIVFARAQACKC